MSTLLDDNDIIQDEPVLHPNPPIDLATKIMNELNEEPTAPLRKKKKSVTFAHGSGDRIENLQKKLITIALLVILFLIITDQHIMRMIIRIVSSQGIYRSITIRSIQGFILAISFIMTQHLFV